MSKDAHCLDRIVVVIGTDESRLEERDDGTIRATCSIRD